MTQTVQILGGHGHVALKLAKILSNGGYKVISLIRDPAQKADVEATGATPVVFDLERAKLEDFEDQFRGADAIVWSAGAGGKGGPKRTYAVDKDAAIRSIEAAQKVGVKRYIQVSFLGSGSDQFKNKENPLHDYSEAKAASDKELEHSKLDWTLVNPGTLSNEDYTGRIHLKPESTTRNTASRDNVAQVIFIALKNPRTIHKKIEFVDGKESIDQALDKL